MNNRNCFPIKYFVPERVRRSFNIFDNPYKSKMKGTTFSGKISLYNIMRSAAKPGDIVFLPAYCCSSVLEPVYELKMEPVFYDINPESLNPQIESIEKLAKQYKAKIIIVPSLYGVPAELEKVEIFCRNRGLFMIDDAAQSAGAKLKGRYVGTFGDAGLISFSPGKNTTAPYGSFILSEHNIAVDTQGGNYFLFKFFKRLHFNYCRRDVYSFLHFNFIGKVIKKILSFIKIKNVFSIKMSKSETRRLSNNLFYTLNYLNPGRIDIFDRFYNCFKENPIFNFIKTDKGEFCPSKIVLIFQERGKAKGYMNYLKDNSIVSRNGYKLLTGDLKSLPNCKKIEGCVVELPIELNQKRMEYLINTTKEYLTING